MPIQPFFSVIIPSYNRKPFLKIAVDSVLEQTFHDFELIIVDDGSSDGTKELLFSYHDKRVTYIFQPNSGVSCARNTALKTSAGKFIALLDSDDRWLPKKLELTLAYIKMFPEINIFHSEEVWYRQNKLLPQKAKHKKPSGSVYKNAVALCCISISTAVVKRDVFDAIGSFDETLEACEDYDFWLRATNKYEVKLIPERLTIKDGGRPDQLSSRVWGLDRFRVKALEKMLASDSLTQEKYEWTYKELENKCRILSGGAAKREKHKEALYYRNLPQHIQSLKPLRLTCAA